jgi:hypothetical protein
MTAKPDDGGGSEVGRASARPERTEGGLKSALPPDDEATGLPGFRTWRGVYAFVLGVFALWVGLLALLTEKFS